MNYCPYCLVPVAGRRRYCSDEHRKRAASQRQAEAQKRARALRYARVAAQERARWREQWRQLAMGTAEPGTLAAIFDPASRAKRRARLKLTCR